MLNLHIIDHSKPVLGEHKAADGFLLKRGQPGLQGLIQTRVNLQYMVLLVFLIQLRVEKINALFA